MKKAFYKNYHKHSRHMKRALKRAFYRHVKVVGSTIRHKFMKAKKALMKHKISAYHKVKHYISKHGAKFARHLTKMVRKAKTAAAAEKAMKTLRKGAKHLTHMVGAVVKHHLKRASKNSKLRIIRHHKYVKKLIKHFVGKHAARLHKIIAKKIKKKPSKKPKFYYLSKLHTKIAYP